MKWVFVTGTARPFEAEAQRRARMVGIGLANAGFGLVTGDHVGVDAVVAKAFVSELPLVDRKEEDCFRQISYPFWSRRSFWPGKRYHCHRLSKVRSTSPKLGVSLSDAAIMIGGRGGALRQARQFMESGKPVFPIPFSGGSSEKVFQALLSEWHERPIPGLTRSQMLRLALPWTTGSHALIELLRGTLTDKPEIFISYRRSDSGSAVGRLQRDLADHFGTNRIFVDETRIQPSAEWQRSIDDALASCKVGLVVIGKAWSSPRLADETDVLRKEVGYLLQNKAVLPVLVDDAGLPDTETLPMDMRRLPAIQARSISNANWDVVVDELKRTIDLALRS